VAAADPGPQIVPTKAIRIAYSGSLIQDGPEVFESDMKYDTTTAGSLDTFAESYAYGDSQDVEGTTSHFSMVKSPGAWWGDGVAAEFSTNAYALNWGNGLARQQSRDELYVEFDVPERLRVSLVWEHDLGATAADYDVSALLSLSKMGAGDVFSD